ncbi:hypothetical protein [Pelomonas sp. Root1444]|uniref:hypothetical protein n=1 Tax=Pelomonas sp. Root1444 TaxID=1736464 RepID=UPI0007023E09|nr:hypothetical protein [Pelomonas sp. Root1444]KQY80870.1 hypothetical protein ASD35_03210 [Pelomonas sp. Root1444]
MITLNGLWIVGLGLYFIFVRPALLPEDVRYIGLEPAAIRAQLPGLERWLGHVFIVMGGFMAGAGVLTLHLARSALWERPSTLVTVAVSGALTVALMSAVNFAIDSDFRWVLLLPVGLWAAGLGFASSARQGT